jgi:rubrerythrin
VVRGTGRQVVEGVIAEERRHIRRLSSALDAL